MHKQRLVMAVLALLGVVGAFLPWFSISIFGVSRSVSGTDGAADGNISLLLYGAAIVPLVLGTRNAVVSGMPFIAAIALALSGSAVGAYNLFNMLDKGAPLSVVGIGLWITILSGIGSVIAGYKLKTESSTLISSSN